MCTQSCTKYIFVIFAENTNTMDTITTRDFRTNMASIFNRVDAGERILVRRNSRMYTVIPVHYDDLTVSEELMERIESARKEIREGKSVVCKTEKELNDFLESL